MNEKYCIGIDYGTDSVRALLVNSEDGEELAASVFEYPRWKQGLYCHPETSQFRQHPLDYIEGLEYTVREIISKLPGAANRIKAISIDTTGSTPIAVDREGNPLSLKPEFSSDPDAMFILWKDHTAVSEAEQINNLCRSWPTDYSRYSGGAYSSEWFWAKLLHVVNNNNKVAEAAYSWVEHCDWMPALLTGNTRPSRMKRCRSAAGHKAMWHDDWNGLPPADFLNALHPVMGRLRDHLYTNTVTADIPAGTLTQEWAKRLGLPVHVIISTGAMDSHFGFTG
jgi:L-ribulokinase